MLKLPTREMQSQEAATSTATGLAMDTNGVDKQSATASEATSNDTPLSTENDHLTAQSLAGASAINSTQPRNKQTTAPSKRATDATAAPKRKKAAEQSKASVDGNDKEEPSTPKRVRGQDKYEREWMRLHGLYSQPTPKDEANRQRQMRALEREHKKTDKDNDD